MRAVFKTMPLGCRMEPGDLIGSFKEAGFIMVGEEYLIQFVPPWFTMSHEDGSVTYVQLKDLHSPVLGSESGNLGTGRW